MSEELEFQISGLGFSFFGLRCIPPKLALNPKPCSGLGLRFEELGIFAYTELYRAI